MPIGNLGSKHITPAQITAFDTALDQLISIATSVSQNLTEEERSKFGSIQERNKLLANGVQDFSVTQPDLRSPDVDWVEFAADYNDRKFADTRADKITRLMRLITDFKIVHDYDNYQAALTDYDFCKYKSNTNTPGFTEKYNYLKQFFANTGGGTVTPSTEKKEE
jgi:hypothetical protein